MSKRMTKQEAEKVLYRERKRKRRAVWIETTVFDRAMQFVRTRNRGVGEYMSAVVKRELDRRGVGLDR